MEGRWRRTTSTAWTGLVLIGFSRSTGSDMAHPVRTSCSMCQLTNDTNLMVTLKGRSFPPSPGRVTSRSTWNWKHGIKIGTKKKRKRNSRLGQLFTLIFVHEHQHVISTTQSYPARGHTKRVSSVEAFLPIINWQTVTKNGHLEMLNHGVHHLPEKNIRGEKSRLNLTQSPDTVGCSLEPVSALSATCWPDEDIYQAWCPPRTDRRQSWGFPPGSSWPEAWWASQWCHSQVAVATWKGLGLQRLLRRQDAKTK